MPPRSPTATGPTSTPTATSGSSAPTPARASSRPTTGRRVSSPAPTGTDRARRCRRHPPDRRRRAIPSSPNGCGRATTSPGHADLERPPRLHPPVVRPRLGARRRRRLLQGPDQRPRPDRRPPRRRTARPGRHRRPGPGRVDHAGTRRLSAHARSAEHRAVRHRRSHRQQRLGRQRDLGPACGNSARRWPTKSKRSLRWTWSRRHEPSHAAWSVGPPRRRGVPVGRADGSNTPRAATESSSSPPRSESTAPTTQRRGRRPGSPRAGTANFAAASPTLGVHDHHLLGFEDGDCQHRDGAELIARYITDLRPDLIVTFGPDGMTGHPDHRAVSRWTTQAWSGNALRRATLVRHGHHRLPPTMGSASTRRSDSGLINPSRRRTQHDELCYSITLAEDQLDAKVAALRAHHSQSAPLANLIGARAYRNWWSTESFRCAGTIAESPRHHTLLEDVTR